MGFKQRLDKLKERVKTGILTYIYSDKSLIFNLFGKSIRRRYQKQLEKYYGGDSRKSGQKNIAEMSQDEFFDYLTNPAPLMNDSPEFYEFMYDYILTAYLDDELTDEDIQGLIGMENPYELNRYVDKMVLGARTQGSFLGELIKYQEKNEPADELYKLSLPGYLYDQEEKKLKIKSFEDLQNAFKADPDKLAEEKRMIALAKMRLAEEQRQEELRRQILANTPEVAEMLDANQFQSAATERARTGKILDRETGQAKKATIIRKAPDPTPLSAKRGGAGGGVNSSPERGVKSRREQDMSPAELIADRKRALLKLKADANKYFGGHTGRA